MKINGIDEEKCIKCGACVKDCPSLLFHAPPTPLGEKKKVIFEDPYKGCIKCGHCIGICPTDAIIYEDTEKAIEFEGTKNPETLVGYDQLMKAIRIRRSMRQYKDKPVPKEIIEKVLEAMRYAPSARNAQSWRYIVLTDKEKINRVVKTTQKMMLSLRKILKIGKKIKFFLPKSLKEEVGKSNEVSLDRFYEHTKQGIDRVFFNAPVVIISYAPKSYGSEAMILNDAGISLTHGMLAAQSLGLGTCWIGFAMMAISRSKNLRKWLGISKKMIITGVLIMGYPAAKYNRAPPRKPLKTKWNLV